MEFVTLTQYDSQVDAHFAQSALENEGIYSILVDQNMGSLYPGISAIGGIRLQVNRVDLNRARSVLQGIDDQPFTKPSGESIQCPACGSEEITTAQLPPFGLRWLVAVFSLVIGLVFPTLHKHHYLCKHCGNDFKDTN